MSSKKSFSSKKSNKPRIADKQPIVVKEQLIFRPKDSLIHQGAFNRKKWKKSLGIRRESKFDLLSDLMHGANNEETAMNVMKYASTIMRKAKDVEILSHNNTDVAYYVNRGNEFDNTLVYDIERETFLVSSLNSFKYLLRIE